MLHHTDSNVLCLELLPRVRRPWTNAAGWRAAQSSGERNKNHGDSKTKDSMKLFLYSALCALIGLISASSALAQGRVLTVDNNVGAVAMFKDLDSAYADANNDDLTQRWGGPDVQPGGSPEGRPKGWTSAALGLFRTIPSPDAAAPDSGGLV